MLSDNVLSPLLIRASFDAGSRLAHLYFSSPVHVTDDVIDAPGAFHINADGNDYQAAEVTLNDASVVIISTDLIGGTADPDSISINVDELAFFGYPNGVAIPETSNYPVQVGTPAEVSSAEYNVVSTELTIVFDKSISDGNPPQTFSVSIDELSHHRTAKFFAYAPPVDADFSTEPAGTADTDDLAYYNGLGGWTDSAGLLIDAFTHALDIVT